MRPIDVFIIMKKITTLLFTVCILAITLNAQKKFSEATISYDIVINTGSDKPQAADFFDGATSIVYLKGPKSRTEMLSSLGTQATIMTMLIILFQFLGSMVSKSLLLI